MAGGKDDARKGVATVAILLAVVVLAVGGCGGGGHRVSVGLAEASLPRVALLPLENLTDHPDAGDVLTRIVLGALAGTGRFEPVEPGEIDAAIEELSLRNTASLSAEQLKQLGERLKVDYVMLGSVLESGTVRGVESDVPAIGATLRLLDTRNARVLWTALKFMTGDEHETVFGWGRENDSHRLAARLAADLVKDLEIPAAVRPADDKR